MEEGEPSSGDFGGRDLLWVGGGNPVVSLVPSSIAGYGPSSQRDEEPGERREAGRRDCRGFVVGRGRQTGGVVRAEFDQRRQAVIPRGMRRRGREWGMGGVGLR